MSRIWPVNILFHTWDRSLFIVVDSRLKISLEKKSRQIQAETSDFILNPAATQETCGCPVACSHVVMQSVACSSEKIMWHIMFSEEQATDHPHRV